MKTNVVKFYLPLVFLLLTIVGCQDENYYDESNNKASKADLFPENVLISDNFSWSTTKTFELSVSVDDKYDGAYPYIIEVYDANPLFSTELTLLGAGIAKADNDFVSDIVVPASVSILYIQQTDPTGEKRVTAVQVEDKSSLSVSFKPLSASAASIRTVASATLRSTTEVVPATPSNAVDMTSTSFHGQLASGNSYVIPTGKEYKGTITTDWVLGGTIFVEGTWTIPSSVNLIYYTVVVQKGGVVKFENENSSFDTGGHLIIAEGATFGKANINVTYYGGGPSVRQITNNGTLNAKVINFDNDCGLVNYGDATIDNINSKNNSRAFIRNSGTITVATITYTGSGASITNNCTLVVTQKMSLNGSIVEIGEGALISVLALESGNSTINMYSNAMLVAETATFIANASMTRIYGLGASFALVKVSTLTFGGWDVFGAYNNVAIAATTMVDRGGRNATYSSSYFVNSTTAAPNIQATDCNGDGNTVNPGVPIVHKLPIIQLGTYTYAFEDNWPTYGDYDMNDFVTDIALVREQSSDNKLTKLTIKSRLLAVGATKGIGAAVQLDGVLASEIKSVTYSNTNIIGKTFALNSLGIEAGQTYAVLPLCDDAHKAFGVDNKTIVNTTGLTFNPIEQIITIEFKSPIELLTNDDLNVFIVTAGSKTTRTEVHLNGRDATDKANKSQFISANLKSNQQVYRSHENLVWGLCVPGSFAYPNEWVKITEVYPLFIGWAESNGVNNTEWYKANN